MKTKISLQTGRAAALLLCGSVLAGCAVLQPSQTADKMIGSPEDSVRAAFGKPTDVHQLSDGNTRWLYSKQPSGYKVYAADFDGSGRLASFRQMLVENELYQSKVDVWTKADVQQHFGRTLLPVQYYPLMKREVWSYRFEQRGFLASQAHFYFDDRGVLRQTQVTLEPMGGASEQAR
jgi:hypothetical protein